MATIARVFADGDAELQRPEYFHASPGKVEELNRAIAATPFTVLLSFEENAYSDRIQAQVRLCGPTFQAGSAPNHPLKPLLRLAVDGGGCPACSLSETSFNAGLGMCVVPAGVVMTFRSLLELADKPTAVKRESDTSPSCCVARKVLCALRGLDDVETYSLTQTGAIDVVTRLLGPMKGQYIHAVVSRRAENELTLLAFCIVESIEITDFRAFFTQEAQLHKRDNDGVNATLQASEFTTPVRSQFAAIQASAVLATPKKWGSFE